ncbi:MAG: hypothetical protein ACYDBJ_20410 [Aggregatilineales bacterium]
MKRELINRNWDQAPFNAIGKLVECYTVPNYPEAAVPTVRRNRHPTDLALCFNHSR